MRRYLNITMTLCAATCLAMPAQAGNPADFPMQPGEMVGTGFSAEITGGLDVNGFVVTVVDSRVPPVGGNPVPVVDMNWLAPMFHNEFSADEWIAANLGQVFGVCLDNASPPNIYVAATTAYGDYTSLPHPLGGFGPGGFAGVYRLDGTTGNITSLTITGGGGGANEIPNTGSALGNICYDGDHNQLFVTNFEDGKIYRLSTAGTILSTFDPFAADDNFPGFAKLGERLWAVQYNAPEGRLYFSVWLRDDGRPGTAWNPAAGPAPANPNNSIWSVAIDAGSGNFSGTEQLEIVMPYFGTYLHSNPVSDIAFSQAGALAAAEKTMNGDFGILDLSHGSRLLEFIGGSGFWTSSAFDYYIGQLWNFAYGAPANASGGTDYDCDANAWATGDALHAGFPDRIYGYQRVPTGGNTPATSTSTSYLIDGNQNPFDGGKATVGDVEVYRGCNFGENCDLDPTGTRCLGMCPVTPDGIGQFCAPQGVITDANGNFVEVTCCDCQPDPCQLLIDPATLELSCAQGCENPANECRLIGKGRIDGTIEYSCECIDPAASSECTVVSECNPCIQGTCTQHCSGPCPNPDEACVPDILAIGGIDSCECVNVNDNDCRPIVGPNGTVECIGQCPIPGEECELVITLGADGLERYDCIPCPSEQRGACCYFDQLTGSFMCTEVSMTECESVYNGTYYGDGSTCAGLPEPCEVLEGACCFEKAVQPPITVCTVTTQDNCLNNLFGIYNGDGTTCVPDPCEPEEEGACCHIGADGTPTCSITTQDHCENALMGIYQGDGVPCTPDPCDEVCDCPGACPDKTPQYNNTSYLATFTGEVAVGTQFSFLGTGEPVVQVIDVKNRATAPLNTHWAAATHYTQPNWVAENLGSVFGVCLDKDGHIYVAATTCYWTDYIGTAGTRGAVYRIDAVSGAISTFATLSNTGEPGLGNIAYDANFDQFYVTNHYDGRIWILNNAGICINQLDHATSTSGLCVSEANSGFVPLGERLWGVNVYNGRVYYSVWNEDVGRPSASTANEIWSIALDGAGLFTGVPQLEVVMPPNPFTNYSNPVADISFSSTGCMLLAERGMGDDSSPQPHDSRVLEYRLVSGSWVPSGINYETGVIGSAPNRRNAAGGCDFDGEGRVYATSDALQFTPQVIYGIQSLPCSGGNIANSALIDMNENLTFQDKTEIGDVEIACPETCVKPPRKMVSWWPLDELAGATTAIDIGWGNDGPYTGTTSIVGKVSRARRFNGQSDFIRVPDHASLDMGTGDFSIDCWVRTPVGGTPGVQVIVEKRENPTRGWSLYLFNGNPGFQLADGAGFSNYGTTTNVADGNWHFVAASVDRNNPTGLIIYVDGVPNTFNPTAHSGSVSNASALWIGSREPAFGQILFNGDIDEVELFRRALTQADVDSIYEAGSAGKCKEHCHVPWDKPFCINQTVRNVTFDICNDSSTPHNYNWSLSGNNECSNPGPTIFSPSSGTVSIPGNTCVSITVAITRPVGLVAPLIGCYDLFVTNTGTGHKFKCRGSVQGINKYCPIVVDPTGVGVGTVDVNMGQARSIAFDIENLDDPNGQLTYAIEVMPSDMSGPGFASLDGLPPGEPIIDTVAIAQGTVARIAVPVTFLCFEKFQPYDVVLLLDLDNDGFPEYPSESIGLRNVIPWGDVDGSGTIDLEDWIVLSPCLTGPDRPIVGACADYLDDDSDDDGDLDLEDYQYYQNVFGVVTVP
jgi:hypothetical protein